MPPAIGMPACDVGQSTIVLLEHIIFMLFPSDSPSWIFRSVNENRFPRHFVSLPAVKEVRDLTRSKSHRVKELSKFYIWIYLYYYLPIKLSVTHILVRIFLLYKYYLQ